MESEKIEKLYQRLVSTGIVLENRTVLECREAERRIGLTYIKSTASRKTIPDRREAERRKTKRRSPDPPCY